MDIFNGAPVSSLVEIKDPTVDLPVLIADLRNRLRANTDLASAAKTVRLPEGLARLSVARDGTVSFDYDFTQARPRKEKALEYAGLYERLSIGPVDGEEST